MSNEVQWIENMRRGRPSEIAVTVADTHMRLSAAAMSSLGKPTTVKVGVRRGCVVIAPGDGDDHLINRSGRFSGRAYVDLPNGRHLMKVTPEGWLETVPTNGVSHE